MKAESEEELEGRAEWGDAAPQPDSGPARLRSKAISGASATEAVLPDGVEAARPSFAAGLPGPCSPSVPPPWERLMKVMANVQ